jgi:hypothetical protein
MASIKQVLTGAGGALTVAMVLAAAPAAAQSTRTFVAANGDDTQPCSRAVPCQTFAAAFARTATNGEIDCIDVGSYGAVTITRSVLIDCAGRAGITINAGSAITINAGVNDTVQLRGIRFNGLANAANAIRILQAGKVYIEKVHMFNFGDGTGINVEPANAAKVFINDISVVNSGIGIMVQPTGTGSAEVTIDGVVIEGGGGAAIRGYASGGSNNSIQLRNGTLSGNAHGMLLTVSGATILASIQDSAVVFNSINGVAASGTGAEIRLGRTSVARNGTGAVVEKGGVVVSYGDNRLFGNGVDGAFTPSAPN